MSDPTEGRPGEGFEPPETEREGRERSGLLPEFVRKMAVAGLGALFMTEEGLRGLAGQLKIPNCSITVCVYWSCKKSGSSSPP